MFVCQTWPICPPPPQQTVHSDLYHAGPVVPGSGPVYSTQSPAAENRLFFMNRSVFDLVDEHLYLSLTDPKLLGWYLGLSPEDRCIIKDEGGFRRFLQRHPALKLSRHHVHVKYNPGSTRPRRAIVASNTQKSYGTRAEDSRCEMACARLELEMLPSNSQRHCGSNIDPQKDICHLQDGLHTAFSSSLMDPPFSTHREKKGDTPSWHKTGRVGPADVSSDRSVDVELERCRWRAKPELSSQTAVTYADVGPFQLMEDDQSVLMCLPAEDVTARSSEVHSASVITDNEAHKSVVTVNSVARVSTCDIMVGTEPELRMSAFTQTEGPGTCDKHVITEVHMADLEYLTEEFIKLRMTKEQLRAQNEKLKSLVCKLGDKCGCVQRAQSAELSLLALQYSMCRQHCWRLDLAAAEGGHFTSLPKSPTNITSVLQKLESDYYQMRAHVLSGVPLDELQPLSVGSEKITRGTSYIPAQIIADVLRNDPPRSCEEPQKHRPSDSQSRNGCQDSEKKEKQTKKDRRRAVTLAPLAPAECKEVKTSEAWYDAQEDLDPAGPAAAAGAGQDPTENPEDEGSAAESDRQSSVLCVSNVPNHVTESDVMLWFEKYGVSKVSVCALKDDLSVAIVMMSGPQSAEAALRELNGFTVQGRTLHVEHVNRAIDGSQNQASASTRGPGSSQDATKPQHTKTESTITDTELIPPPSVSSAVNNRKVVCVTPSAKATCVPQHYGTMGSFDTLMAELTSHHPDVGRQRIVDALMALRAEHKGVLNGLPLSTIREMTSELLTRPQSAARS